jgi:hypothetical protein
MSTRIMNYLSNHLNFNHKNTPPRFLEKGYEMIIIIIVLRIVVHDARREDRIFYALSYVGHESRILLF